jgi:single-stranded-DNA-specific exonuclease
MLRSKTRWQQEKLDQAKVERLVAELDLHPIIARLVVQRGLTEPEEVQRFLSPSLTQLYDPFLLDDMKTAVERIQQALEKKEKILVYGDYDADGVSSTSLLMKLFRSYEANVDYYIPNRFREGYGLNKEALQLAADQGFQLIITVDTGISAVEEAKFAKQLGLDLIITDHHEPPAEIPQALAVINPKKPNCPYPFKMLAGVGIAMKLATALLGRVPEEWLDLVALGTIADLVPLVDENRVIASFGLKRLDERRNIGLQALLEVSGIDGDVSAGHVGFSLGPRVNASGRLASAKSAVELMLTEEFDQAKSLALQLDQMNRERQQLVEQITQLALEQVEAEPEKHQHVIVVAGNGWNSGVIGIVASRLVERFYRPVIVFGIDPDTQRATGSARSIEGFHLHRALTACEELLLKYGGHSMAAGMSISAEKIDLFHQKISSLAQEWLTEEDYIPMTKVDGELQLSDINVSLIEQLKVLEPYGMGNPTPHFVISNTRIAQMKRMGVDRNHLRLQLTEGDHLIDVVAFRKAELAEEITERARVNILGQLQINEWNGRRSPQIILRDLAIPHIQIFDWRSNREKWNQIEKLKDAPCLFCRAKYVALVRSR